MNFPYFPGLLIIFCKFLKVKDKSRPDITKILILNCLLWVLNFINKEHQRTSIDMLKFFKYDWRNLKSINLMNCEIRDQDWKLFVKNAHKIPNLKEIKICT